MSDEITPFDDFSGECDPELDPDCFAPPMAKHYAGAHFALWFLCVINSVTPILYWYVWFKPEMDADPANTAILDRNWWWMGAAWPMIVWGHIGLWGFPAFWGLFTWFGVKFFDKVYQFWMVSFVNYIGTIMHFLASLAFLAGAGFWIEQDMISVARAWGTAGAYVGWTVITFIWAGLTTDKSNTYMYLRHCKEDCYVEIPAEEDEEAEEIPDDATTFHAGIWDF